MSRKTTTGRKTTPSRMGDTGADPKAAFALVESFIQRINAHDPDKLMEVAAEEHTLVDAADQEITGREAVRRAWKGFFGLFPDYQISFDQIVGSEGVVGIFGTASGTAAGEGPEDERHWSIPVAWKAVVRDGRVVHWQVYCETEPMRRSLAVAGIPQGSSPSLTG